MAASSPLRPMRRGNREITDRSGLESVLDRAEVLHLALHDEPAPYVVPVNFAYADGEIWLHGAPEGRKIDLVRRDSRVGFAAVADARIVRGPVACDFSATGSSVIGRGTAQIVTDPFERRRGLDILMRRFGMEHPDYRPASLARACVVRIDVEELRGKLLA